MKKLYSCLLILSLFTSCTPDNELVAPATESQSNYLYRTGRELPVNLNNSFDITGMLYSEMLDAFYLTKNASSNVTEVIYLLDSIAVTNARFQFIKGNAYIAPNPEAVKYVVNNPISMVPETISKSGLSTIASFDFLRFLEELKSQCKEGEDFDLIYEFIVSYENTVSSNLAYTSFDKQIILTGTSIARFSTYQKKRKPKKNDDRDWDLLIAGIVAGTDSMIHNSTGTAILTAATVAILSE